MIFSIQFCCRYSCKLCCQVKSEFPFFFCEQLGIQNKGSHEKSSLNTGLTLKQILSTIIYTAYTWQLETMMSAPTKMLGLVSY